MSSQRVGPPLAMRMYSSLLHRLPVVSGLTRLSFNRFTAWGFRRVTGPITARLWDGTPVDVWPNDYHGRVLYLFGTNDPKVTLTAKALARDGDAFLDIGANYSSIGLAVARAVEPRGQVHLFEPQKDLCSRVENAIQMGGYGNVTLHPVGLWREDATLSLARPEGHSGMATFVHRPESSEWTMAETCEVRNIATYAAPLVEGGGFGVKLDIEGGEPEIMPWLLEQSGLRFLIFEAAHHHRQLFDLVRQSGLTLFGLKRHPFRLRLVHIDEFEEMGRFHDLVGVRLDDSSAFAGQCSATDVRRAMADSGSGSTAGEAV